MNKEAEAELGAWIRNVTVILDNHQGRIKALEAAQPAPLQFPKIEPDRLPSVQAAERLGYAPFDYEERN